MHRVTPAKITSFRLREAMAGRLYNRARREVEAFRGEEGLGGLEM